MRIAVTLKDPDTMGDSVDDAVKRMKPIDGATKAEMADIRESRAERAKDFIAARWMEYGEYLTVVFDTEKGTATVLRVGEKPNVDA